MIEVLSRSSDAPLSVLRLAPDERFELMLSARLQLPSGAGGAALPQGVLLTLARTRTPHPNPDPKTTRNPHPHPHLHPHPNPGVLPLGLLHVRSVGGAADDAEADDASEPQGLLDGDGAAGGGYRADELHDTIVLLGSLRQVASPFPQPFPYPFP